MEKKILFIAFVFAAYFGNNLYGMIKSTDFLDNVLKNNDTISFYLNSFPDEEERTQRASFLLLKIIELGKDFAQEKVTSLVQEYEPDYVFNLVKKSTHQKFLKNFFYIRNNFLPEHVIQALRESGDERDTPQEILEESRGSFFQDPSHEKIIQMIISFMDRMYFETSQILLENNLLKL